MANQDVAVARQAVGHGDVELALVGGEFVDPPELAAAGTTWPITELPPGDGFRWFVDDPP